MGSATRLTSKGQVVIPKAVRDRLRWRAGTRLEVEEANGSVVLKPQKGDRDIDALLDQACGCLNEGDPISDLEAEHRTESEADERWVRRYR